MILKCHLLKTSILLLLQCYYIGATDDAATKIINEVSKPLSHHIPVEKICEKLKKKDSQICELKYGKCDQAHLPWPLYTERKVIVEPWRAGCVV